MRKRILNFRITFIINYYSIGTIPILIVFANLYF